MKVSHLRGLVWSVAVLMLLGFVSQAYAAEDNAYRLYIDQKPISLKIAPVIEHGVMFVPMKQVLGTLGYTISLSGQSILVKQEKGSTLRTTLNNKQAIINGRKVSMKASIRKINGSLYIPLLTIADLTGKKVQIDSTRKLASIGATPVLNPYENWWGQDMEQVGNQSSKSGFGQKIDTKTVGDISVEKYSNTGIDGKFSLESYLIYYQNKLSRIVYGMSYAPATLDDPKETSYMVNMYIQMYQDALQTYGKPVHDDSIYSFPEDSSQSITVLMDLLSGKRTFTTSWLESRTELSLGFSFKQNMFSLIMDISDHNLSAEARVALDQAFSNKANQ